MRRVITFSILAIMIFGASACKIGPDYKRPSVDSPSQWRFEEKEAKDTADTAWWRQFNDPVLNELIETALKNNYDVLIAAARVEEYMGKYGVARSALFPQIGAEGAAGRQRASEQGAERLYDSGLIKNPADFYKVNVNASWEIDIWGRLRRATESARASLLSTEEGRRAVVMSLVASVANAYIDLRALDKQLEIAQKTAQSRKESYDLFLLRFQGGLISEQELSMVKSEYEGALAKIPATEKQIVFQENAISLLLGRNPGPVARGSSIDALVLPAVPSGLPSGLLERRPDVRQAEQNLIAANAQIGVARGLYFPSISLTGLFGWSSNDLSKLFTGPARTWSYAGTATAPIFTAGSISGQVQTAEAVQQEMLFTYKQAVQSAFRDVENSLADQKRTREQLEAQGRQVQALATYAEMARLRYDNGYTSYIEVLDAERNLFNAQLSYADTQSTLFQSLVNLYKAMGGGWVNVADKMTASGPK